MEEKRLLKQEQMKVQAMQTKMKMLMNLMKMDASVSPMLARRAV